MSSVLTCHFKHYRAAVQREVIAVYIPVAKVTVFIVIGVEKTGPSGKVANCFAALQYDLFLIIFGHVVHLEYR
jgi:hypothetical protein